MGLDNDSVKIGNKDITRVNTKRKILIIEDNVINQQILINILEDRYDTITAENGLIGLELLKKHYNELSLVMLDVYMPVCNGFQFLEITQKEPMLATVPVIVTTGSEDPEDEVKCLRMGVYDFVTKPYNRDIVLARIDHIIALKESVTALAVVENDPLTGMYNMQAFVHKAQQLLTLNPDKHFDLLLADIEDFKLVNDNFGEDVGDSVLLELAKACRAIIPAFVEARSGDKFYFLCDCVEKLNVDFSSFIASEISANLMIPNLSIKFGVYHHIDSSVAVSSLCDRVNMAIDQIRHNYNKHIAFYDESLRQKLLENQKMEADFITALENNEFYAWYQPKIDARTGKIIAAEALARWIPYIGKMISPAQFVPLFERNGQIADLDEYIFKQVCILQKELIASGKRVIPISVNLSRNSIYRGDLVERYLAIAKQYEVPLRLVPLELTESAATENKAVKNIVDKLAKAGFEMHMDDFGTGYSSLSSIISLPFSVIKLDKSIIDQIGCTKADIVLKYMIGGINAIGLEVVAEGVENEQQIDFLKGVGCNLIQGYYYSAPKNKALFLDMLEAN